jgi:fructose 1,6-bisphosphatase
MDAMLACSKHVSGSWRGAGFAVSSTESMEEAKQFVETEAPTVLVLCHTLQPAECKTILETAHAKPHVTTLLLEGSGPMSVAGENDEVLARYRGPKELVKAVTRLAALAESGASAG